MRIATFVSPHGFGHAARSCAVMEALLQRCPGLGLEIFSTVPQWFFADSLRCSFRHHPVLTDVGLAQRTSLREDLHETVARLDRFLPLDPAAVQTLAGLARALSCRAVVCDISPLGLAVAQAAELPSVLVENFTWDFIYQAYLGSEPRLARAANEMRRLTGLATHRVRTRPVCGAALGDLEVAPVSRRPRLERAAVRAALGVPETAPMVLLTMGGIPWRSPQAGTRFSSHPQVRFVIPGGEDVFEPQPNLVLLRHHNPFYHPDLVGACDAVVGKVGYSTVAEVYRAGVPFGYVPRDGFPESPWLVAFISEHMSGLPIAPAEIEAGTWVDRVEELLALRPHRPRSSQGAEGIAELVIERGLV